MSILIHHKVVEPRMFEIIAQTWLFLRKVYILEFYFHCVKRECQTSFSLKIPTFYPKTYIHDLGDDSRLLGFVNPVFIQSRKHIDTGIKSGS